MDTRTFVDESDLRNTVKVCSCAETSSMVLGRLRVGHILVVRQTQSTNYFSTHGCSAGSIVCFGTVFAVG